MPGNVRKCLRDKTIHSVMLSNLPDADKTCIFDIFVRYEHMLDKDQTEMKHGRWVEVAENSTGKIIACTNCKKHINPNKKDVAMNRASERPGYCPHCGARMDLEEGEAK